MQGGARRTVEVRQGNETGPGFGGVGQASRTLAAAHYDALLSAFQTTLVATRKSSGSGALCPARRA